MRICNFYGSDNTFEREDSGSNVCVSSCSKMALDSVMDTLELNGATELPATTLDACFQD